MDTKTAFDVSYTRREKLTTLIAVLFGWAFDGFDLMIVSFLIPEIIAELNITAVEFSVFVLLPMLGITAVGGILFGVLADKIGRQKTLNFSILLYSLATGVVFFCPSGTAGIVYLSVLRLVAGLGIGGEWAVGFALLNEVWGPTKHRGKLGGITHGFFGVGVVLAAVLVAVAAPLGWRAIFGIAGFPALLVFFIRFFVPESKIWLKYQEAKKRGVLPEYMKVALKRAPVSQIFEGEFAKITKRCTILAAAGLFVYYIVFSWLPTLLKTPIAEGGLGFDETQVAYTMVAMALVGIPACTFGGWLSDSTGRRKGFFIWTLFGIAGMALFWYAGAFASSNVYLVLSSLLVYSAGLGYFGVYGVWFGELYPTRIRGTGPAFCFNIGRGIAASAPVFVAILALMFRLAGGMSIALLAFIGMALIIWFIPETRGRDLKAVELEYEQYMEQRRKLLATRREFPTSIVTAFALGITVLILILPWSTLYAPTLRKAPEIIAKKSEYVGTLAVYNFDLCAPDRYNITATEYINSTGANERLLNLKYEQVLLDTKTGKRLVDYEAEPYAFTINRRTLAFETTGFRGQFAFPIGVEKKNYEFWNRDIKNVSIAKFVSEEMYRGLRCYKYQILERNLSIEVPKKLEENISGCKRYYDTLITLWVETKSGSVVNIEKTRTDNVSIPDLRKLPEDLNISRELFGTLYVLNDTTAQYELKNIVVNTTIRAVAIEDNILKLNDTTRVFELKDDRRIELVDYRKFANYAVERKSARYVYLPNYSSEQRFGLFTFPVGCVKTAEGEPVRTFEFWNTDMKKTVTVNYVNTITHPLTGMKLYVYRTVLTNESKPLREFLETEEDPVPGGLATYNATLLYYIEPSTGIAVDMNRSITWKLSTPPAQELYYRLNTSITFYGTYVLYNATTGKYRSYNVTVYSNLTPKLNRTLFEKGLPNPDPKKPNYTGLVSYWENITYVDNATGKVLDIKCYEPVVAIGNLSMLRYIPEREMWKGLWRLPPNPTAEKYELGNPDINTTRPIWSQLNETERQTADPLPFLMSTNNFEWAPENQPHRCGIYNATIYITANKTAGTILNIVKQAELVDWEKFTHRFIERKWINISFSPDARKTAALGAFVFTSAILQNRSGNRYHAPLADLNINFSLQDVKTVSADAADKGKKLDALSSNTIPLVELDVRYSETQLERAVNDARTTKSKLEFADLYIPITFALLGSIFVAVAAVAILFRLKAPKKLSKTI